jgi:pantetheine-phosphate adenylyltransferase
MSERHILYPGTFDPVHRGHLDVLARTLALFDRVTVVIAAAEGTAVLPVTERVELFRIAAVGLARCEVASFSGLLVDELRRRGAVGIVRGVRSAADYEHERALAGVNGLLAPQMEGIYLLARPELSPISSTLVRDVARHGGDLRELVPAAIAERLQKRLDPAAG